MRVIKPPLTYILEKKNLVAKYVYILMLISVYTVTLDLEVPGVE